MLPNLQSLKPDDLRWNWCNNKRNKVHSKSNMLESSQNLSLCCPGAWKNGLLWNRCLVPKRWGTTALNRRQCLAHNSSSVKNCWMIWYFCVCVLSPLSHVWCFLTLWTIASQALLTMGFSRQEYWSELPFPSPGHLPEPEIESAPPSRQTDSLPPTHQGSCTLFWLQVKHVFPQPQYPAHHQDSPTLIKNLEQHATKKPMDQKWSQRRN